MVTTKASKHKKLMEAGGVSKLHLAVFQGKQEKVRERERETDSDRGRLALYVLIILAYTKLGTKISCRRLSPWGGPYSSTLGCAVFLTAPTGLDAFFCGSMPAAAAAAAVCGGKVGWRMEEARPTCT